MYNHICMTTYYGILWAGVKKNGMLPVYHNLSSPLPTFIMSIFRMQCSDMFRFTMITLGEEDKP